MKHIYIFLLFAVLFISCSTSGNSHRSNTDYTQFVNPFVGTSKMGHVFPGATAPFGMVQLSPQTNFERMHLSDGSYNTETYEYCAGYQYRDSIIIGFTHTNFSGTGHSDLGDFLIMPTVGDLILDPLTTKNGNKGFYSRFSHENEDASPGFYSVNLDSYKIKAELTTSKRVGFHQYTFSLL
jgi:putative alpha-1,2-mannosidase